MQVANHASHARASLMLTVIRSAYLSTDFIQNTGMTFWESFSAALFWIGTPLVQALFGRSWNPLWSSASSPTDLESAFGPQYPDCLQNIIIKYPFHAVEAVFVDDPLTRSKARDGGSTR